MGARGGHEHADVGLVAQQCERVAALRAQRGVGSGYESLSGGFLVACGAVDLSGEVEAAHETCLERVAQLCRVEEVVFDGIAGAVYLHVAECRYGLQGFYLYVHRQRGGEAVEVVFGGGFTLGLEEQLVLGLVGKGDDFRFYGRAVARAYALYLSVVQGRVGQPPAKHFVGGFGGIDGVAGAAPQRMLGGGPVGKAVEVFFVGLLCGEGPVYAASVDAHGGASFHACGFESEGCELLGDAVACRLGYASAGQLYAPYVHEAVEESAVGEHYLRGRE